MRAFNLDEARAGKPVCTRLGQEARILCYNLKDVHHPIVAAFHVTATKEQVGVFTTEGHKHYGVPCSFDLMMRD